MTSWQLKCFPHYLPFVGESAALGALPSQRASNAQLWFRRCYRPEEYVALPVIWDDVTPMRHHKVYLLSCIAVDKSFQMMSVCLTLNIHPRASIPCESRWYVIFATKRSIDSSQIFWWWISMMHFSVLSILWSRMGHCIIISGNFTKLF